MLNRPWCEKEKKLDENKDGSGDEKQEEREWRERYLERGGQAQENKGDVEHLAINGKQI